MYNPQSDDPYEYVVAYFSNIISQTYTPEQIKRINESLAIATTAHAGQIRSNGSEYVIHPIRVAILIIENNSMIEPDVIIGALLHDTLEDTTLTIEKIYENFGSNVAHIVGTLTRYRSPYETPTERKQSKKNKWNVIMQSEYEIRLIKAYDYVDNVISWKFIQKDHPHYQKIPRWLMEAETMYLPLVRITDPKATKLIEEEIENYKNNGLRVGNWSSDSIVSSRLMKRGSIYVDTKFDPRSKGDREIEIDGKRFYRFMDFFYIPDKPMNLSSTEIIELCDLRLEYYPKVVNHELNSQVATCISNFIINNTSGGINILDFGCGDGSSLTQIQENLSAITYHVTGIDISEKAIQRAKEKQLNVVLTVPDKALPFDNSSFEVVFAIFVFHFVISEFMLQEIARVLAPGGFLIFNSYQVSPNEYYTRLAQAGFSTFKIIECSLPQSHFIAACGIK